MSAQPRPGLQSVAVPHLEAGHGGRHPDEVPAPEDHHLVPVLGVRAVVHDLCPLLDDVVVADQHGPRPGEWGV